jgi:2-methylcitrate dehydratase PrpD
MRAIMKDKFCVSRRNLLKNGMIISAAVSPLGHLFAAGAPEGITSHLARYMLASRDAPLPDSVAIECKNHILDTLGAMISGSQMRPGQLATHYVKSLGGTEQASVVGSKVRTTVINAALANGMCAHSDETDDFEPVTKAHPGSSVVPAAMAMAEFHHRSGEAFMRAVALGYDVGCRLLMALGPDLVRGSHRSAEGTAATFGAVGAAASLAQLNEQDIRFALSYAAQQESGLWSWVKDHDHIEKAFDFAGMGARNGVQAVTMVQAGMTGVDDVLDGTHNLLIALSSQPHPQEMIDRLGERFFVTETAIKTYSVGYPIQAPLDAILTLRKEHGLVPEKVKSIEVRVPSDAVGIVGDSAMPDVNCAHMVAIALMKGKVSFIDSHDVALMQDPALKSQRAKIKVIADPALDDPAAPRSAKVTVVLNDGTTLSHYTRFPSGTKENPLSVEAINSKVRDLISPVIGQDRSEQLIRKVNNLETLADMAEITALITL